MLVASAVALLLPALVHGVHLGPFDILANRGLEASNRGPSSTTPTDADRIDAIIPWVVQWRGSRCTKDTCHFWIPTTA